MQTERTTRTHLVFVYGSLMRGFGNHGLLARNGAEFLKRDETISDRFTMQHLGGFPGVVADRTTDRTTIKGELYRVDDHTLAELDMLEGVPTLYQQRRVKLQSGITATIYIFQDNDRGWSSGDINSGDWRDVA